MSLKSLLEEDLVERAPTSPDEIAELAAMVERDLSAHRAEGLPRDWEFAIAYSAALNLATITVRAEGYRARAGAHHYAVLAAFGVIAGEEYSDRVSYLQSCRVKRHRAEYDRAGQVTSAEVESLVREANDLKGWVMRWPRFHHAQLLPTAWEAERAEGSH